MTTELLFKQLGDKSRQSLPDIWNQTTLLYGRADFTDWKGDPVPVKGLKQSTLISTLQLFLSKIPSISATAIDFSLVDNGAISKTHTNYVLGNASCLHTDKMISLDPDVKVRVQSISAGDTPSLINPDICTDCKLAEFCASHNLYGIREKLEPTKEDEKKLTTQEWIEKYVFGLVEPSIDPINKLIKKFTDPSTGFRCPGLQIPELITEFSESEALKLLAEQITVSAKEDIKYNRIINFVRALYSHYIPIKDVTSTNTNAPEFDALPKIEQDILNKVFIKNIINTHSVERINPELTDEVEDVQEIIYRQCQNLFWFRTQNSHLGNKPQAIEYIAERVVAAVTQDYQLYWSDNYNLDKHLRSKELAIYTAFNNFIDCLEITPEKLDYFLSYPQVAYLFGSNQIDTIKHDLKTTLKKRINTLKWEEIVSKLKSAHRYYTGILQPNPNILSGQDIQSNATKSIKYALIGGNSSSLLEPNQELNRLIHLKEQLSDWRSLFGEDIQVHIAAFSGLTHAIKVITALEDDVESRIKTTVMADKKGTFNPENMDVKRTPLIVDINVSTGKTVRSMLKTIFDFGHKEALIYIVAPVQKPDTITIDGYKISSVDKESHFFIVEKDYLSKSITP